MNRLIPILLITFLTFSCSKFDSDSFTLVCNVNSEWEGTMDGRKGNEKKNETITFVFKNKKLDGFECLHWDEEKIICSVDINKPTQQMTESLSFDRLSGVVNYKKFNSHSLINLVERKSYIGKCEKVKENKF